MKKENIDYSPLISLKIFAHRKVSPFIGSSSREIGIPSSFNFVLPPLGFFKPLKLQTSVECMKRVCFLGTIVCNRI